MSKFERYRAFAAIVENKSLASAARQLATSPSSVSKQLSKLEDEVGARLIERSTHSLAITSAGEAFYPQVKDILDSVEEAEQLIRQSTESPEGRIVISMPHVLLKTPLFALFREFGGLHPGIKLDLKVSASIEDLIARRIDFAFRIGELEDSQLTAIPIARLNTVFCASPDYVKRHPNLKFNTLLKEGHLILPDFINSSSKAQLLSINELKSGKTEQLLCHSANDAMTLDELAMAGMGVIPTFDVAAAQYIQEGRMLRLFPNKKLRSIDLSLVYHRRNYFPAHLELFKNFIKDNLPKALK